MKYYIDNGVGDLTQRHWCDNPDCPNYVTRATILTMQVVLPNGQEFCTPQCEQQSYIALRRYQDAVNHFASHEF